jgi:hypothetical protein
MFIFLRPLCSFSDWQDVAKCAHTRYETGTLMVPLVEPRLPQSVVKRLANADAVDNAVSETPRDGIHDKTGHVVGIGGRQLLWDAEDVGADSVLVSNRRYRGVIVGLGMHELFAREWLSHPSPPQDVLRIRLSQLSAGMTPLKVQAILAMFPSKRLLLRYVGVFPRREDVSRDLETRFSIPPWHSVLLASRLIAMRKSDLEFGIIPRTVAVLVYSSQGTLHT